MKKGFFKLASFSAALTATIGSLAWACTPRAAEIQLVPSALPVDSQGPIRVISSDFMPGEVVEIRWNAATGPLVGGLVGADRSVAIRVPAGTRPGVYYVLAAGKPGWTTEVLQVTPGSAPSGRQSVAASGRYVGSGLWSGFGHSTASLPDETSPATSGFPTKLALGTGLVALAGIGSCATAIVARRRRVASVRKETE